MGAFASLTPICYTHSVNSWHSRQLEPLPNWRECFLDLVPDLLVLPVCSMIPMCLSPNPPALSRRTTTRRLWCFQGKQKTPAVLSAGVSLLAVVSVFLFCASLHYVFWLLYIFLTLVCSAEIRMQVQTGNV
jgi:hypothetical protein